MSSFCCDGIETEFELVEDQCCKSVAESQNDYSNLSLSNVLQNKHVLALIEILLKDEKKILGSKVILGNEDRRLANKRLLRTNGD